MKRLKEASTWAGLAAILQALKTVVPQHAVVLDGLTAIAGTVAAVVPDKGAPTEAGK
ncbi:hypothetical protein GTP45_10635 [Pseudoduganella sp. FT55W]|uniref:Uncharacterized protein n=1 Tax=Duganella rivi TaxID=2666083 RepID=A0A7X4GPK9_9BURK|nr:hypothetical protein [Duganella rivi]MYM67286.1 hypothetical protein [Duganella rivi]